MSISTAQEWWNDLTILERKAVNQLYGITDWSNVDPKDNPMGHIGKGDYSVNIAPIRYERLRPEAQNTVSSFFLQVTN